MSKIIEAIEKENMKTDVPAFNVGDSVKVFVKVVEGQRERLQAYEGTVIARRGGGVSETFVVRHISFGVGVERCFPLHSPKIDRIEVVKSGRVRRAKLYYLRGRSGKSTKIKEVGAEQEGKTAEAAKADKPSKAAPAAGKPAEKSAKAAATEKAPVAKAEKA